MKKLLIMNKYPQAGRSKTRLGKDVGYENSAKLATYLLEDLVKKASSVCDVTIVTPNQDLNQFKFKYPQLDIYGSCEGLTDKLADSIKHEYSKSNSDKVIAITGDLIVSEKEIDGWFSDLETHNLIVGPTKDFRFYQAGFDKRFGNYFAQYISENPNLKNLLYAGFRTLLHNPSIKINAIKRDIDTIHDLQKTDLADIPKRTKDYILSLISKYQSNLE